MKRLELLSALYKAILVPEAVYREVVDSGRGRAGSKEVRSAGWIEVVPGIAADKFLEAELGRGESQVIALAIDRRADLALIDELVARRVASQVFGLRVCGSAGILVQAKRAGLIPAIRPLLEGMKRSGYYLSERLVERACREAGE